MKVFEIVIGKVLRERINIDRMQFGIAPGRDTQAASRKIFWKEKESLFCLCRFEENF